MMLKRKKKLISQNSYGGFDPTSDEYLVFGRLKTPRPWVNICANPLFGTLITEGGEMFSWYKNSHLYQITPRIDDPVLREGEERLYLRDEASGRIWQPTKRSRARHGKGYSVFESERNGISFRATVLVSLKSPLKMIKVELTNNSRIQKTVSATYYNRPILGEDIKKTKKYLQLSRVSGKKLISAKNPGHADLKETTVFFGARGGSFSYELDRLNFFGRKGDCDSPEALFNLQLSSKETSFGDPCAAVSSLVGIPPKKTKSVIFFISVDDKSVSQKITESFFDREYQRVRKYWQRINSTVEISTPNPKMDALFNRQLLYQVLVSRMWARTGFYQPGGAYGYRDQLQDAIALCWAEPKIAREHILRAASRQFFGGGVQHWWHPPRNAGVRSLSSDAHLWLVYATIRYIEITGDEGILKEKVPFLLTGRIEHHGQDYFSPQNSEKNYTLYDHCEAAINRTVYLLGKNGLPLILAGDWNDSLDSVGRDKRGESVWLAIFLAKIASDFSSLAAAQSGSRKKDYYLNLAKTLRDRVDKKCWDGQWYLRAFWDSGEKLGSRENNECRIDSIPQSWATIAGFNKKKAEKALNSANEELIDRKNRVVKLFDPPFEKIKYDPGYVLLYPPGVRENGGAYAHAAAWLAQANAIAGRGEMAMEIVDGLNPLKRVTSDSDVKKYQAEPYVLSADIYTASSYAGTAGWTWYTGSASVLYGIILEDILGLKLRGEKLYIKPSVPESWSGYSVRLKYKSSSYEIYFRKKESAKSPVSIKVGDKSIGKEWIVLRDDGKKHEVRVFF